MNKSLSLLAFVALGILAACDSGTGSNGGSGNPSDLVGSWKGINVSIDTGYDIYTDTTLLNFSSNGQVTSLTHEKDSSLSDRSLSFSTYSDTGTWKSSGNKLYLTSTTSSQTDTVTYSISGTKLTVTDNSGPSVFTRQ
jgi:hypothetical protein